MSTALEKRADTQPMEWTREQVELMRSQLMPGASDAEFQMNLAVASARRLNPITKQIHFVSRWNQQAGKNVWTHQVSIDGLRAIAERTGLYAGQDEAEYGKDEDGAAWCRVRVYRKDWGGRAAVGKVYWLECVQNLPATKGGGPVAMWASKPKLMWAKCAEAAALRKAFPEDTGGLYADDEMPEPEQRPAQQARVVEAEVLPPSRPREPTPKALAPAPTPAPEVQPAEVAPGITQKRKDDEATRLAALIDASKSAKALKEAGEQVARSKEIGLLDGQAVANLQKKYGMKQSSMKSEVAS